MCFSKTSVNLYHAIRRQILLKGNLHSHRRYKMKPNNCCVMSTESKNISHACYIVGCQSVIIHSSYRISWLKRYRLLTYIRKTEVHISSGTTVILSQISRNFPRYLQVKSDDYLICVLKVSFQILSSFRFTKSPTNPHCSSENSQLMRNDLFQCKDYYRLPRFGAMQCGRNLRVSEEITASIFRTTLVY